MVIEKSTLVWPEGRARVDWHDCASLAALAEVEMFTALACGQRRVDVHSDGERAVGIRFVSGPGGSGLK